MPIYKQTTEITNIDKVWASISKDIVEVYFGDKNVFTVWAEIENALPLTVYASGDDLANYKVFGNTKSGESVGELTENLFDSNATDTTNGYRFSAYLPSSGNIVSITSESPSFAVSEYIGVPNDNFITLVNVGMVGASRLAICFYNANKEYISGTEYGSDINKTVEIPSGSAYFRFTIVLSAISSIMIVEGSTAPTSYIPYGYKLPMVVTNGTTTTTTPIYIGSDPLAEDEYVDFGEQKVYRRTENLIDVTKAALINISGSIYRYGVNCGVLPQGTYTFTFNGTNNSPLYIHNGETSYTIRRTDVPYTISANGTESIIVRTTAATDEKSLAELGYTGLMLIESSTAPSTYIPYYDPQDPPVPLPALPTIRGETIIDYNPSETPAVEPEKMYVKYRKQGT